MGSPLSSSRSPLVPLSIAFGPSPTPPSAQTPPGADRPATTPIADLQNAIGLLTQAISTLAPLLAQLGASQLRAQTSPTQTLLPTTDPTTTVAATDLPSRSTPQETAPVSSTTQSPNSAPSDSAPAPSPPPADPATPTTLANGFVYPIKDGKIIQTVRDHKNRARGNWESDNAIDIGAPEGTPIYAPADGVVSAAGGSNDNPSSMTNGFNFTLQGQGDDWFLTHMSKRVVKNGDRITKGQLVGYSGSANNVPHLHIGQRKGNPEDTFRT